MSTNVSDIRLLDRWAIGVDFGIGLGKSPHGERTLPKMRGNQAGGESPCLFGTARPRLVLAHTTGMNFCREDYLAQC